MTGLQCIKHWLMMSPMLRKQNTMGLFKPTNVMTGLILVTVIILSLLWFSQSSEAMQQAGAESTTNPHLGSTSSVIEVFSQHSGDTESGYSVVY